MTLLTRSQDFAHAATQLESFITVLGYLSRDDILGGSAELIEELQQTLRSVVAKLHARGLAEYDLYVMSAEADEKPETVLKRLLEELQKPK